PMRSTSVVAPQALALLNNEFVLEQARYFAERVMRERPGRIPKHLAMRAYQLAYGHPPRARELENALEFLKAQAGRYRDQGDGDPALSSLRDLCHALFNSSEYLYVD